MGSMNDGSPIRIRMSRAQRREQLIGIAREPDKEETAAHVVNLLWLGLRSMERDPILTNREG